MEIEFTSKDFCKIIDKCRECEVSELKFGGFYVKFDKNRSNHEQDQTKLANQPTTFSDTDIKDQSAKFDVQTQVLIKDMQDVQKLINDPLAFEQSILDGDLEEQRFATTKTAQNQ